MSGKLGVLKYEESATPKDSKSESTKSFNVRKARSLEVRRVCDPLRFEVWKYEEFQSPKYSGSLSTSLQPPKNRSLKVRRVSKSEGLGLLKYEESTTPKIQSLKERSVSKSGRLGVSKYKKSATPKDFTSESTKSFKVRNTRGLWVRVWKPQKNRSMKVRRVWKSGRLGVLKYKKSATPFDVWKY